MTAQEIRESEEKFRKLAERSLVGIYLIQDGIFQYVNPKLAEIFGYTVEELTDKKGPKDLVLPEDWHIVEKNLQRRLTGVTDSIHYDFKGITKNRDIIFVDVYGSRADYKGKPAVVGTLLDITKEREAAALLWESEERYRSVVDKIAIGIAVISPEMKILSLNSMMKKWFPHIDVSKKPICFKTFNNPPKKGPCSYCPTIKTLRDGKVHESVTATPAGDKIRNYRVISSPLFDKDGKVIAAVELVDDVTECKKTEETLRESEKKFRTLFEASYDGIMITDIKTMKFRYVNQAMCRMLGYSEEELKDLEIPDLHPKDKLDEVISIFKEHARGRLNSAGNIPFLKKNGMTVYMDITGTRSVIDGTDCSLGFFRDITIRKAAETQIRTQNELLNNILNSMTHPFYVIDANDYTIKLSNHAAHFEINDKNMTCYELTHHRNIPCDNSEHPCTIKKIKETKEAVTLEHIHYDKDNNPRTVEVHGYPIFDAEGKIAQVIEYNLDITERKKAVEERKRLNKELQQIIHVTSHDLRSPLVNVEGYHKEIGYSLKELEAILKDMKLPQNIKEKIAFIIEKDIPESVRYIDKSVAKMDSLLSGLLRLSRSGREDLQIKELDMNRLVSDVLYTLEYEFKENGARHEVTELPSCSGDANYINQTFSNLIGNALKFFDPARPGVIHISGYKKDGHAVYCVEDNGIGIPAEHQDKIFDIFHQVQRGKGGEGLGLSIVKKIVERHNGKVWVESEFGKGSRFYVSLPA